MSTIVYGTGIEGTGLDLWGEITAPGSEELVEQSSLSAITAQVWLIPPPTDAGSANAIDGPTPPTRTSATTTPQSLTVADVIFDAGDLVTIDGLDCNFVATIPVSWLPTLDLDDYPLHQWIRVDVKFTPTSGEAYIRSWVVDLEPVLHGKS